MDDAALTATVAKLLETEVILMTRCDPISPESLSPGERARYDAFSHARRREDWLRGRGALKALLRRLHLDEDTAKLVFPHARISLSHAAGLAVAAGTAEGAAGMGVDFEAARPLRPGSERFYLDAPERAAVWTGGQPPQGELLRLWTAKEALFKADLENRGKTLTRYRLRDPGAISGLAQIQDAEKPPRVFRYASLEYGNGYLSVAIRRPGEIRSA